MILFVDVQLKKTSLPSGFGRRRLLFIDFQPFGLHGLYTGSAFLYQCRTLDHLVHIKAFYCTNVFCRTFSVPRNLMASRFFQVCKTTRTWNCISLVISCLTLQVRTYSRTLEPVASLEGVLLVLRTSRCAKPPAPETLLS